MRTQVRDYLIATLLKGLGIVPAPKLREGIKASSAHPVLETIVVSEVRRRSRVGVAVGEAQSPIWRRGNHIDRVVRLHSVLLLLARPSYSNVRKIV